MDLSDDERTELIKMLAYSKVKVKELLDLKVSITEQIEHYRGLQDEHRKLATLEDSFGSYYHKSEVVRCGTIVEVLEGLLK